MPKPEQPKSPKPAPKNIEKAATAKTGLQGRKAN